MRPAVIQSTGAGDRFIPGFAVICDGDDGLLEVGVAIRQRGDHQPAQAWIWPAQIPLHGIRPRCHRHRPSHPRPQSPQSCYPVAAQAHRATPTLKSSPQPAGRFP